MHSDASLTNQTSGERIPAIERATGRPWQDWMDLFTREGAKDLPHPEIAKIARREVPDGVSNPDWWAQSIAIAFEQQLGIRVPGQSSSGDYRVGASRTVELDRDAAIAAWAKLMGTATEHRGYDAVNPRQSRTDKRTFWRANFEGAGSVEAAASAKSAGRSTLAVNHTGLESEAEIEPWRAHWKHWLRQL